MKKGVVGTTRGFGPQADLSWATPENVALMQALDSRAFACSLSLEARAPGTLAWAMGAVVIAVLQILEREGHDFVPEAVILDVMAQNIRGLRPEESRQYIALITAELDDFGVVRAEVESRRAPRDKHYIYLPKELVMEMMADETAPHGDPRLN